MIDRTNRSHYVKVVFKESCSQKTLENSPANTKKSILIEKEISLLSLLLLLLLLSLLLFLLLLLLLLLYK